MTDSCDSKTTKYPVEYVTKSDGAWTCGARRNATADPVDCNWPICGCDPHANKVIEALEEMGALQHD